MKHGEKWIEKTLREKVELKGGMCIKLLPFLLNGLPDRLILLPGAKLYFVETKTPGDKPSKIQKVIHGKLNKLGFPVYIIDNEDKLNNFLKLIL